VRAKLRLGCETRPDVESANVVAELRGRERPDEIVLIGAHLDSWDVGTGAIDDAAGVGIVIDTLRLLKAEALVPRRSVRAVLFMNEENGLRGALAYAADHAGELPRHVAALEADAGAGRALGFRVHAGAGGLEAVMRLARPLAAIGADSVDSGVGGADISVFLPAGVPLLGLRQDATRYFDWHHTVADTFDKVDEKQLAQATAAFAAMTHALADAETPLPRPEPQALSRH
jgi:Zn-dependent M28 family amino/carboxypeptidase